MTVGSCDNEVGARGWWEKKGVGPLVRASLLFLAICLGCIVFNRLMRWGVIPTSVCEACADIRQRGGQGAKDGYRGSAVPSRITPSHTPVP